MAEMYDYEFTSEEEEDMMFDEQDNLLLLFTLTETIKSRRACRWHVRLLKRTRAEQGKFSQLVQKMRQMDHEKHFYPFLDDRGLY